MVISGVEIFGVAEPLSPAVVPAPALAFAGYLHRTFEETRQSLLGARAAPGDAPAPGAGPGLAPETASIRDGGWRCAPVAGFAVRPARTVSLTTSSPPGSVAPGGDAPAGDFLCVASFEDAATPAFPALLAGQARLRDMVVAGLADDALLCCPRGWHLPEAHVRVDGEEMSAALFDFAIAFFHNAPLLAGQGRAIHFLLPKLEHYLEARLWHNVFVVAQSVLDLPLGHIRATPVIETVPGMQMAEEILYELHEHAEGLAFDGTDYLFSHAKTFADDPARLLPDALHPEATAPMLAACRAHLSGIGRRRGLGGLLDLTLDPQETAAAGTESASTAGLTTFGPGVASAAGLASDVFVGIGYLAGWLRGEGLARIGGRWIDTAAAELCRARIWQWRRHGVLLDDGTTASARRINGEIRAALGRWKELTGDGGYRQGKYREAATVLLDLVLEQQLPQCFTLPCYRQFFAG